LNAFSYDAFPRKRAMESLIDSPLLLPAAVATTVLAALHIFSSRHRALGFMETAFLMSALSVALIALGIVCSSYYGWVLFVLCPFLIGVGAVVLYGRNAPPRTLGRYVAVGSSALALVGTGMIVIAAREGIFLFLAAPIACELMLLGTGIAYRLQARFRESPAAPALLMLLIASSPLLMGAEAAAPRLPPLYVVRLGGPPGPPAGVGGGKAALRVENALKQCLGGPNIV
jgi:hypothetical protein